MERIVALVEGHTEYHFVKSSYANAIVQRPFSNGDHVDLRLIAASIVERLETVSGAISKVVILMDREGRTQTAAEVRDELRALVQPHCGARTLYIGVSDREFENWVAADEVFIRSKFANDDYVYPGDGCMGKNILKRLHGFDASFRDKAEWLKATSSVRGRQRSGSLDDFLQQVDFYWHWVAA